MGTYTSKYTGEQIDNLLGKVEDGFGKIYSTEEQVIGTWIDGKPLYRKVYTFNITSKSTRQNIVFDEGFGADKVLKNVSGVSVCTDVAGYQYPLGLFNHSGNQYFIFLICCDASNLKLETQWSVTQNFRIEAIVEYTKTTD